MSDKNPLSLSVRAIRERTVLRNVYLWMAAGLTLTGVVALGFASSPQLVISVIRNPILFFGLIIGEFVLVFFLSARIQSLSPAAATMGFAFYAILNGVTLSLIFLAYTGASIASALFITAGTFAGMSIYAVTTKRDLSSMGHYLIMGLWGLIIASLVNMLLKSTALYWLLSYGGVALFLGLTAYDTQMIKRWSDELGDSVSEADYLRISILGALKLYLDFINLFLFILRIFGRRR
ncbi:MAG: BAX inhibitor (BI)-1/YccA family protein [Spirochaetes bacterium]|nr:MAG: BAX inhibitor (BI)-1/YccA family protein [Spirochaetota bacterium]